MHFLHVTSPIMLVVTGPHAFFLHVHIAIKMVMGLITKPYALGYCRLSSRNIFTQANFSAFSYVSQRICCIWVFYRNGFTLQIIMYVNDAPNMSCWERWFTDLLVLCISACSTRWMFSSVVSAFVLPTTPLLLITFHWFKTFVINLSIADLFGAFHIWLRICIECHDTNSLVKSFC